MGVGRFAGPERAAHIRDRVGRHDAIINGMLVGFFQRGQDIVNRPLLLALDEPLGNEPLDIGSSDFMEAPRTELRNDVMLEHDAIARGRRGFAMRLRIDPHPVCEIVGHRRNRAVFRR